MNRSHKRHTIVFIVRVWAEFLNEQTPSWRGVIEGHQPGEKTPFTSLNELNEIIQRKTQQELILKND